jgi:hypothetical protein
VGGHSHHFEALLGSFIAALDLEKFRVVLQHVGREGEGRYVDDLYVYTYIRIHYVLIRPHTYVCVCSSSSSSRRRRSSSRSSSSAARRARGGRR